jgi:hypothetical protein
VNIEERYNWRKLIINALNEIQSELPTNQLLLNDIHIWPIIKIRLFFTAYYSKNSTNALPQGHVNQKIQQRFFSRGFGFIKRSFQYFYLFYLPKKHIKYLTLGAWSHRIFVENKWLNRYYVNIKHKRIHIEYADLKSTYIDNAKSTFTFHDLFSYQKRYFPKNIKNINVQMENNILFKQVIDAFNAKIGMTIKYNAFNNYLSRTIEWSCFWDKLLKNLKPKEIRMLCYYDDIMLSLCIAANKLSLPVIDMQHGTQGGFHVAYSSFGKLPNGGYNSIPSAFSVWDLPSQRDLENAQIVPAEKIILEGNPWIEFNKSKFKKSVNDKTIDILYTLQTGVPIHEFVYEVIAETSTKYKWVLKTHPRMKGSEITVIEGRLKELIAAKRVEIDTKSNLLPLLLSSKLHTSAFSGSIQEARLMNIPTIISDALGVETFRQQLEQEPEYFKYALDKTMFIQRIQSTIINNESNNEN